MSDNFSYHSSKVYQFSFWFLSLLVSITTATGGMWSYETTLRCSPFSIMDFHLPPPILPLILDPPLHPGNRSLSSLHPKFSSPNRLLECKKLTTTLLLDSTLACYMKRRSVYYKQNNKLDLLLWLISLKSKTTVIFYLFLFIFTVDQFDTCQGVVSYSL